MNNRVQESKGMTFENEKLFKISGIVAETGNIYWCGFKKMMNCSVQSKYYKKQGYTIP